MSAITTHVLDTSRGRPAAGVTVTLEMFDVDDADWRKLGRGATDADGRLRDLLPADSTPGGGVYRLTFDTLGYFFAQGAETFYPFVHIVFVVRDPSEHHHVPLLLSPYGYSTYRGS